LGKNLEEWQNDLKKLWEEADIPNEISFHEYLDYELMKGFSQDATGVMWSLFFYFDNVPWKPLTPRELLQFWGVLTEEERLSIMLDFS
jgi:hypothetical protein